MIRIRNSEIEDILNHYEMYGHLMKMYLYYDYENNKAYLRFNNNGKALCYLNDFIDGLELDVSNISDREIVFNELIDIIFKNEKERKKKMNYRDKIRKYIECPEFGNSSYGDWGSLRIDQRRNIKRLLDELDGADDYIKKLYKENQKLKEAINKAINEIETGYFIDGNEEYSYLETWFGVETLLNILKEVE